MLNKKHNYLTISLLSVKIECVKFFNVSEKNENKGCFVQDFRPNDFIMLNKIVRSLVKPSILLLLLKYWSEKMHLGRQTKILEKQTTGKGFRLLLGPAYQPKCDTGKKQVGNPGA